jgi:hypothetical protein
MCRVDANPHADAVRGAHEVGLATFRAAMGTRSTLPSSLCTSLSALTAPPWRIRSITTRVASAGA